MGRKEVLDPMSWWNIGMKPNQKRGEETPTSPSSSAVLQVLLFPNNLFPSLTWSSFQVFTEVYEIDLTGNQVSQASECSLWLQVPTVVPSGSSGDPQRRSGPAHPRSSAAGLQPPHLPPGQVLLRLSRSGRALPEQQHHPDVTQSHLQRTPQAGGRSLSN